MMLMNKSMNECNYMYIYHCFRDKLFCISACFPVTVLIKSHRAFYHASFYRY